MSATTWDVPVLGGVVQLKPRQTIVTLILIAIVVLAGLVALAVGDLGLSLGEVVSAIFTDQGFRSTVVREWRMPRVLASVLFGAALAISGAVFQSLTRNPLGSPDVIGFSTGSYTGAIIVLTVLGQSVVSTSIGALVGGLATAVVVYLLSWRGGIGGFRLIIVGIAVSAMLSAANTWLLLRAQVEVAMAAAIWGAGSLALINWGSVVFAGSVIIVLLIGIAFLAPSLRELELGDDAAKSHGVPVEPTRIALMVVAVALTAVVTAAAGPIAFVALAAPQIASRITGSVGIPLVASACTGALLLVSADFVAQHVLPSDVAAGMVTVVVGGCYLIWLLIAQALRRSR